MSYYYKSKDTKFSSYSCVKAAKGYFYDSYENESRKFNSYIKTIINSSRYLTESVKDGFDTYFFGVLIHRRLDSNRYDLYCSSKVYAYYVIKKFHMLSHDEYEKIYTTISDDSETIKETIKSLPQKEKSEIKINFERNFRFVMINQLSEFIDEAIRNAHDATKNVYIEELMKEIVNVIIETKTQEIFSYVTDEKLLLCMDMYEKKLYNAKKYEAFFLSLFSTYLTNKKPEIDDKTKNATNESKSTSKPSFQEQLYERISKNLSQEKLMRKAVISTLKLKEQEIKNTFLYTNETISDVGELTLNYEKEHLPVIALILNKYVFPFIGEQNINIYYREYKFYDSIEKAGISPILCKLQNDNII